MNRNQFLLKTGAVIATAGAVNQLFAQGMEDHSQHGNTKTKTTKFSKAKMSAIHCILAAEDCLSHCIELMGNGDKSMGICAATTRDVIASCNAFLSMASQESSFTKKMAALCIEVCEACAKECKKHAEHHEVCKVCMKSCNDCAKEMKKV